MKTYTIHLLRHGLTEGNLKGQYIGSTDIPLCEQGKQQILTLKSEHPYPDAAAFFASPLKRCTETLALLYPNATPILIQDFAECDFGEWEGKTADELKDNAEFNHWVSGGDCLPKGGESGEHFQERVRAAFEKVVESLLKTGTPSAVIVAHGGTLMTILSTYGLPRASFFDWRVDNGKGYSLRITPSLWMRGKVAEVAAKLPAGEKET